MVAVEVVDVTAGSALRLQVVLLLHIHCSFRVLAFLTEQILLNEFVKEFLESLIVVLTLEDRLLLLASS